MGTKQTNESDIIQNESKEVHDITSEESKESIEQANGQANGFDEEEIEKEEYIDDMDIPEMEVDNGEEDVGGQEANPKKASTKKKRVMSKKKISRPKKSKKVKKVGKDDEMNQRLVDIYSDNTGEIPDMKHLKKIKRSRLLTAFFTLLFSCVFFGAVAWVGFFYFQPSPGFSEEDVMLSISGDEAVMIGEEVTYRLRYRNSQTVPLAKAVLQVRYPEGFVFVESSVDPTNDDNDEWALGAINEHDSGFIDITGMLYGNIEEKQSFRAFLNYTPSNFSSEFQKVANVSVEMDEAPVEITMNVPENVVPGIGTDFTIIVKNNTDEPVKNMAIVFEGGSGFVKKMSTPESDEYEDFQWSIESLEDEVEISLNGVFNTEEDVEKVKITANAVGWKDSGRQIDPYIYSSKDVQFNLLKTDFVAGLMINGTMSDLTVQPAETLNTSISLKNTGLHEIDNVRVRMILDAPSLNRKSILNWSKYEEANDSDIVGEQISSSIRRGVITWNKSHIDSLSVLYPDERFGIDFHLPIKSSEDIDLTGFQSHEITAVAEIRYSVNDEEKIYSTTPIKLTINSDAAIDVRDDVSEDDDGKEIHTITWVLENSYHELKDISALIDYYGDVELLEDKIVVPAGETEIDHEAKVLKWKIDKMPTDINVLALQFAIRINKENLSQTNLTSKLRLNAFDTVTGKNIILAGDEILINEQVPTIDMIR